jgi:voltage-gated potassium channel
MKSLNITMERRGFGYVMALTIAVILVGSAGMYTFEHGEFESYWEAIWWTTMLVITVGTDFWPGTMEGRILCTLLSLYGFGVFGYITATLASFFIGRDAHSDKTPVVRPSDIEGLRMEIRELKQVISSLAESRRL